MTWNQLKRHVKMSKWETLKKNRNAEEEPLEAEVPRARMYPKNPTIREKQEHEDSGHAVYRNWCAACVKVEELVDNIELNC